MSLRYIRGMERLWGGILLFSALAAYDLSQEGEGLRDVAWWRAMRWSGLKRQLGWAVLRPGYLAFLPSEGQRHMVADLAGAVAGASGAVMGVHWVSARAKMPVDLLLQLLANKGPQQFDAYVAKTVRSFGGIWWEVGDAEVAREEIPIRPSRHALVFRDGVKTVGGTPTREQSLIADQLLQEWAKEGPIPVRHRVGQLVFVSALVTVPALLLAWGGHSMGKSAEADLGTVEAATILDHQAVPDGSFVTVSGRPDLSHFAFVEGDMHERRHDMVLVLEEAPHLILYCRHDQPLTKALHEYQSGPAKPGKPDAIGPLKETWVLRGRVYEASEGGAPFVKIPPLAIHQFATEDLGLTTEKDARVLVVGMEPSDIAWNSRLAFGFASVVGVVAIFFWLLTAWAILRALASRRVSSRST